MPVDLSHLPPALWVVAAILVVIVALGLLRFFWQHIVRFLLQGCLVIVGILILLEVLHYLKVF
jgi:hypothetical protein